MHQFPHLPKNQDSSVILDPKFNRRYHRGLGAASVGRSKLCRAAVKPPTPLKINDSIRPSSRVQESVTFKRNKVSTKKTTEARDDIEPTDCEKLSASHKRDWSRDPAKCPNSDWAIHIYKRQTRARGDEHSWETNSWSTIGNDDIDTYYIDTKALDRLPQDRIPLFEQVFMDAMEDMGQNQSRIIIEKDEEAAHGFGILLDFLYAKNDDEEVALLSNVQRGLALYRLADYFQVEALKKRLADFYNQTTERMTRILRTEPSNARAAASLSSSVRGNASSRSHRNDGKQGQDEIKSSEKQTMGDIEKGVAPNLLLDVLKQRKSQGLEGNKLESENMSCLVAVCLEQNKDKISRTLFYTLTSKQYIPHLEPEAALQLLTLEHEKGFWKDRDTFSSVESRAIRALLADWDGFRKKFQSDELYWKALRKLSPSILGFLLMHASKTTQADEELSSITDNFDFQAELRNFHI